MHKPYTFIEECSSSFNSRISVLDNFVIVNPVNAYTIEMIGITKFKTAYGAYCRVGTPSVPKINTPHVFQGTKNRG